MVVVSDEIALNLNLTEVKNTRVFVEILSSIRMVDITSPTTESISSVASPIGPRGLRPQKPSPHELGA
eukprot:SAG31_NODE_2664_length_5277_cov_461.678943_3_plen_68_part_00